MYIEAIVIGLIIGLIRNGRISNFGEVRFKGWPLAIAAFFCFIIPYGLGIFGIPFESPQIFPFAAMGIIVLLALANHDRMGMKLIALGTILNMVAMAPNYFLMPLDLSLMNSLGYGSFVSSVTDGSVVNYIDAAQAVPWTVYFGKFFALPAAYPLSRALSIGDVAVSLGVLLLIQSEMRLFSGRYRGSTVQFSYRSKIGKRF
ncbi:MAG: hypothetical protein PWQ12_919 [Clostridiales bacterium]|jgi:hypothetical protein|nr:hypothetical protein [Clostridiales bacterium]